MTSGLSVFHFSNNAFHGSYLRSESPVNGPQATDTLNEPGSLVDTSGAGSGGNWPGISRDIQRQWVTTHWKNLRHAKPAASAVPTPQSYNSTRKEACTPDALLGSSQAYVGVEF